MHLQKDWLQKLEITKSVRVLTGNLELVTVFSRDLILKYIRKRDKYNGFRVTNILECEPKWEKDTLDLPSGVTKIPDSSYWM